MHLSRHAALLALAIAGLSHAQQPPVNGMRPSNPARYALVGGKVLVAPGQTIEKATVLIKDGAIEAVGADLAAPAGYRVFDVSGKTLVAAFIEPALVTDSAEAQVGVLKAPGAHWNQYVTPEVSAADIMLPDATVEALRAQGFAVARVLPSSGVFRGSSDTRLLFRAGERAPGRRGDAARVAADADHHLAARTVQFVGPRTVDWNAFFGQTPGTPPSPATMRAVENENRFPSSLMGSYALLRQTFMDANWRARALAAAPTQLPIEDMNAFDALLPLVDGRHGLVLDASDELEVERLVRLARVEMPKAPIAVLGSGSEFRAEAKVAALLADAKASLIVPIEFPQAPDLVSPMAADTISLRDLMTWRYAPTNPKRFVANGSDVSLTTHRMQDKGAFRKKLADAIAHGLTKDEALAALTTVPARQLGVDARIGTIEVGKLANIVIAAGDPLEADTKFEGMFVGGTPVTMMPDAPVLAAGNFTVTANGTTPKPIAKDLALAIDPKDGSIKATWTPELKLDEVKLDEVKLDEVKLDEAKPDDAPKANAPAQPAPDAEGAGAAKDEKPKQASASAKRASVTTDGRGSGMFDGAPFGFDGEIRVSFAGTGDRATMTADDATGARVTFTLTRVAPDPKKDEPKPEPKNDEKNDEKKEPKKDDAAEKEKAERANLWTDRLPFPFGEHGLVGQPLAGKVMVKGATIWTLAAQGTLRDADLLVENGKIAAIGRNLAVPADARVVDGKGMHITPGLIDCHSHTGISGGVNEGTQACTAEVWIGDVIDPTDINWYRQLSGGLTAANQLHGSANPIGGRNSVVKIRWGEDIDGFRFKEAPSGIKFALGENVVRTKSRYPNSRMGVATFMEDSFRAAQEYRARQKAFAAQGAAAGAMPPRPDLELETLAEILEGTRLVHCHSYRQDEILMLLETADRFGFRVATLQHVLEGFKVAPEIAKHGAGASSFSDWWAYKIEVMDAIPWNGAMLQKAGVLVSFNSDSDELARRMNMEAAKAVRYGNLAPEEALKLVTLNPAKQLRIDGRTGSLEVGKDADFALWNGEPLSGFTRCEETYVDGVRRYSRADDEQANAGIVRMRAELIAKATASPAARDAGPAAAPGEGGRGRRGRPGSLLEQLLENREDTIWLRIARGLDPIPRKQGDCGCGAVQRAEEDGVPVMELSTMEVSK
jgi:N-acetylglucosamine-6-phosphate deacetylase